MSVQKTLQDIDIMDNLLDKYPTLSIPLIQMKLKCEYARAKEIYDLWMSRKRK